MHKSAKLNVFRIQLSSKHVAYVAHASTRKNLSSLFNHRT